MLASNRRKVAHIVQQATEQSRDVTFHNVIEAHAFDFGSSPSAGMSILRRSRLTSSKLAQAIQRTAMPAKRPDMPARVRVFEQQKPLA